jgi:AcrR family transcriptional regulator
MTTATTKQRITGAARRLLESGGARAVSLRRVAAEVGLTPMAVYRHHAGLEALLEGVADQGFLELAAQLSTRQGRGSGRDRIRKAMGAYVDYALERPRLFDLMFVERRAGARRYPEAFRAGLSPTGNLLVAAVRDAMRDGSFRRDEPWEVALAIWAHVHGLVALQRSGRFSLAPAGFRALCRRSLARLLRGLEA